MLEVFSRRGRQHLSGVPNLSTPAEDTCDGGGLRHEEEDGVDDGSRPQARGSEALHRVGIICALLGTYAASWALLLASWWFLGANMKLTAAQAVQLGTLCSTLSFLSACVCYSLLMCHLVLRRNPWAAGMRTARSVRCRCRRFSWRKGKVQGTDPRRRKRTVSPPLPRTGEYTLSRWEKAAMAFPLVLLVVLCVGVDVTVPRKFAQTKEIVFATARCIADAIYMLLASLLLVARVTNALFPLLPCAVAASRQSHVGNAASSPLRGHAPSRTRMGHLWERRPNLPGIAVVLLLTVFVVLPFMCWQAAHVWCVDVVAEMQGTVLERNLHSSGKAVLAVDFCTAEGGRIASHRLRRAWVLPQVLPRRFFNFYMGEERCGPRYDPADPRTAPLGVVDAARDVLLVPSLCPSRSAAAWERAEKGERPRVFFERPWLSEMQSMGKEHGREGAGRVASSGAEGRLPGEELQRELEEKYGQDISGDVVVRRNARGDIDEIELQIDRLSPRKLTVEDNQLPPQARELMALGWPRVEEPLFFEVALGRSATITVSCPSVKREQMFFYPVTLTKAPSAAPRPSTPPRNVAVLMLDATSRPEVLRSLPHFAAWMRHHQREMVSHAFTLIEGRGHTTFGFSTGGNFAPSMTGTSALAEGGDQETYPNVSLLEKTLFSLVKQKYGDGVKTSLAMGYCHNVLHAVFGGAKASTGDGRSCFPGLDRYFYGPMCRREYSAQESNIRGPYSIRQRCLGVDHVHDLLLSYTKSLLLRHKTHHESFFDLSYFIEGHEGTHSVLSQVDASLVDLMYGLFDDVDFTSDPKNVLVVYADHGSHMGPYYLSSEAGRMERAMPFLLFLMHNSVFTDLDTLKRRPIGATEMFFLKRANGLTTPMDLFLTLADLLGVQDTAKVSPVFAQAARPPRSMFDPVEPDVWQTFPQPKSRKGLPPRRPPVSSEELANMSLRKLEAFPLATHWCDF